MIFRCSASPAELVLLPQVDLSARSDALNIYSLYGNSDHPLVMPPAWQQPAPFGVQFGGVFPQFVDKAPEAAFDSWITIGGTSCGTLCGISAENMDLDSWTDTQGLNVTNGALFFMDPSKGPALTDRLGDGQAQRGEVVIAQLTVPAGGRYSAKINAQGHAKGYDHSAETSYAHTIGKPPNLSPANKIVWMAKKTERRCWERRDRGLLERGGHPVRVRRRAPVRRAHPPRAGAHRRRALRRQRREYHHLRGPCCPRNRRDRLGNPNA